MANIYDANGKIVRIAGFGVVDYDKTVKAVNHKGYNTAAPENTIPAFKLSKEMGFNYVECDITWTSDGVAVLSHDDDVTRAVHSDTTVKISETTYQQLLQYDFSRNKSKYSGTKIATAEEFLLLCRAINLHPYLEIKHNDSTTEARIAALVDLVNRCGMRGNVTYISFNTADLSYVHANDQKARIGFLVSAGGVTDARQTIIADFSSGGTQAFVDANYMNQTSETINTYAAAGIPLELWTVNDQQTILDMNPYVTGVTSDTMIAGKVLYDSIFEE